MQHVALNSNTLRLARYIAPRHLCQFLVPQICPPPHPQFPCIVIDCLVNTENGYAYWKQVAFSLLNWSVTAKKSLKREMLFPWFSCFQWNSPSVHRSAFRSNYEIRSRRNMYYFSRVSTDVSETLCCDTISCNVPVSLMRSAVYPP